jgi:hypothetical protein
MATTPPPLPIVYDRDADHLKVLSIVWYVFAALQALAACFMLLYIGFGVCVAIFGAAAGTAAGHAAHDPSAGIVALPFAGMGIVFAFVGGILLLLFALLAFLMFKCGQSLSQRRHITLCYVMAAISCLSFPIGTLLGVFTFIVLARPSVQQSFK